MDGRPCYKYKGFVVKNKQGEGSQTLQVCEDCMSKNPDLAEEDEFGPCPGCGTKLDHVVKKSRMGCAMCYDHFGEPLSYIIAALQLTGETKHVGRVPESFKLSKSESVDPMKFATELSQKMRILLREEKFEEAARLKPVLSRIKALLSSGSKEGELGPQEKAELARIVYDYMYPKSL